MRFPAAKRIKTYDIPGRAEGTFFTGGLERQQQHLWVKLHFLAGWGSIRPSTVTSGTSHGRKGTLLDQADFMACRWDFCLLGKPPVPCVQAALRSFHPCGLLQKINTRFAQVLSSPRAGFRPRQDSKISWHKINSAATWGKGDISINTVSNYEGRSWGQWDRSDQTHLKRKLTPDAYGIFFFF